MEPSNGETPRVTLQVVAAAAGVNASTVSRALSGSPHVRAATRDRVLEAATRLNYRPVRSARTLASRRSMIVGVLLPELRNLMYADLLEGAQDVLGAHGYSLFICDGRVDPSVQSAELTRLLEMQVDALIVARSFNLPQLLEPWLREGIPVEPSEVLEPDEFLSGRAREGSVEAFRHLLALGHRRFAFFVRARADAPQLSAEMRSRIGAFNLALAAYDLSPAAALEIIHVSDPAACTPEVDRLLSLPEPPTALVAGNDWMSAPLLGAIGRKALEIPRDISVICYGDSRWAEAYRPPISVIRYDYRQEGAALAHRILARLGAGPALADLTWPAPDEFVDRASCGPPSALSRLIPSG